MCTNPYPAVVVSFCSAETWVCAPANSDVSCSAIGAQEGVTVLMVVISRSGQYETTHRRYRRDYRVEHLLLRLLHVIKHIT